jgi:hypothetical protein
MYTRIGLLIAIAVAASAAPQFEAASIRPVKDCGGGGSRGNVGKSGGGGPPPPRSSPGRLNECGTVMGFINSAYLVYADGQLHYGQAQVGAVQLGNRILVRAEAGPGLNNSGWLNSDRYMITATAPGNPPLGTILGPMLRALLEDASS